jgi:hypothetical protein
MWAFGITWRPSFVVCHLLTFHILISFLDVDQSELPVVAMFFNRSQHKMSNHHRGHSIDASCQVSVNLAKRFQRRRFKKNGQSATRIGCGGHGL